MRRRVDDEESGRYTLTPKDYEKVLQEAATAKDNEALQPLGLDGEQDAGKLAAAAGESSRPRAFLRQSSLQQLSRRRQFHRQPISQSWRRRQRRTFTGWFFRPFRPVAHWA